MRVFFGLEPSGTSGKRSTTTITRQQGGGSPLALSLLLVAVSIQVINSRVRCTAVIRRLSGCGSCDPAICCCACCATNYSTAVHVLGLECVEYLVSYDSDERMKGRWLKIRKYKHIQHHINTPIANARI